MQPQAQDTWSPTSWKRREGSPRSRPPPQPLEGAQPCHTLISDGWPPEPGEDKSVWFKPSVRSAVTAAQGQVSQGPCLTVAGAGLRSCLDCGGPGPGPLGWPSVPRGRGTRTQALAPTNPSPPCRRSSTNWTGTPRGRSSWMTCSASCRSEVRPARREVPDMSTQDGGALLATARGRCVSEAVSEFSVAGGIQEMPEGGETALPWWRGRSGRSSTIPPWVSDRRHSPALRV